MTQTVEKPRISGPGDTAPLLAAAPEAARERTDVLVRMPADLKRRLADEVEARGGNLNDVAVGILASRFAVPFQESGRRGAPQKPRLLDRITPITVRPLAAIGIALRNARLIGIIMKRHLRLLLQSARRHLGLFAISKLKGWETKGGSLRNKPARAARSAPIQTWRGDGAVGKTLRGELLQRSIRAARVQRKANAQAWRRA